MKKHNISDKIIDAVLILCAAHSVAGTVISAYSLDVNTGSLFWRYSLPAAILITALTVFLRYKGIMIASGAVLILFILQFPVISDGFMYSVYIITALLNKWLPIPVMYPQMYFLTVNLIPFWGLVILCITILLGVTISLKHSASLTLFVMLPLVAFSFTLLETQAAAIYLLGIISVFLTLVISDNRCTGNSNIRLYRILPAFTLSVVFVSLLYFTVHPGRYVRSEKAGQLREYVFDTAEKLMQALSIETGDSGNGGLWYSSSGDGKWSFNTDTVNIAGAGRQVITNHSLLTVKTANSGIFYIRGFSMGDFDGRAWTKNISDSNYSVVNPNVPFLNYEGISLSRPSDLFFSNVYPSVYLENNFTDYQSDLLSGITGININRLNDSTDIRYTPYYVLSESAGFIKDTYADQRVVQRPFIKWEDYDFTVFNISDSIRSYITPDILDCLPDLRIFPEYYIVPELGQIVYIHSDSSVSSVLTSAYTAISGDTAAGLRELAFDAGIDFNADREEIADMVADFITSTGLYTLAPAPVPENEDFALYFLQTSRSGYCIHFATAATLMLRALDIPARFTSGYVVEVSEDNARNTITLTDRNAHAWVEVFYDDAGWLPLEVTPPGGNSGIPSRRPHTAGRSEITPSPFPVSETTPGAQLSPPGGSAGAGGGISENKRTGLFARSVIVVAVAAFISFALISRRLISQKLRDKRFSGTDTNAAVIAMWRHVVALHGGRTHMPSDIEKLALKARFSHHRIDSNELARMRAYVRRLSAEVYDSKNGFGRFWIKYIRALI